MSSSFVLVNRVQAPGARLPLFPSPLNLIYVSVETLIYLPAGV